jgi:hypothetical protein
MSHYHPKSREYTNKILEAVEAELLDKDIVIMACLKYMSEQQVKDMAEANEFFAQEEEEDEDYDPMDDFNYVGSRHHY